jgi:hypothetical protein
MASEGKRLEVWECPVLDCFGYNAQINSKCLNNAFSYKGQAKVGDRGRTVSVFRLTFRRFSRVGSVPKVPLLLRDQVSRPRRFHI